MVNGQIRGHAAYSGRPHREGIDEMIQVKRVYEAGSEEDGVRFLVERLWPRGIKKEDLAVEGWLKDLAPSTKLRKWFNHDPTK